MEEEYRNKNNGKGSFVIKTEKFTLYNGKRKTTPFKAWLFCYYGLVSSKKKVIEQQAPDEVNPAADARDADTEDETKNVIDIRFFDESRDTDDDFDDPVDTRDQKQDELDKSWKTIEPFHYRFVLLS